MEQAEKKLQRAEEALKKLEVQAVDREENKDIALGTSKLNYLDPRISVAWSVEPIVRVESNRFDLLQVQKVGRADREDLFENSTRQISLGNRHGDGRLSFLQLRRRNRLAERRGGRRRRRRRGRTSGKF